MHRNPRSGGFSGRFGWVRPVTFDDLVITTRDFARWEAEARRRARQADIEGSPEERAARRRLAEAWQRRQRRLGAE